MFNLIPFSAQVMAKQLKFWSIAEQMWTPEIITDGLLYLVLPHLVILEELRKKNSNIMFNLIPFSGQVMAK